MLGSSVFDVRPELESHPNLFFSCEPLTRYQNSLWFSFLMFEPGILITPVLNRKPWRWMESMWWPWLRHLSCSTPSSPSQPNLGHHKIAHVVHGERVTDRGAVRWNNTKNESRAAGLTHWVSHFLAQWCSEHPWSYSAHSSHPVSSLWGRRVEDASRMSDLPLYTHDQRKGQLAAVISSIHKITVPIWCHNFKKEQFCVFFLPWNTGQILDSFCPLPNDHRDSYTPQNIWKAQKNVQKLKKNYSEFYHLDLLMVMSLGFFHSIFFFSVCVFLFFFFNYTVRFIIFVSALFKRNMWTTNVSHIGPLKCLGVSWKKTENRWNWF